MAARVWAVSEISERWGCSSGQVYRLVAEGRLHAFRVGRLLRIKESALAEFESRS